MAKMTKRQVLRELVRRGWRIDEDRGRTILATDSKGSQGVFEPRELLLELEANDRGYKF